MIKALLSRLSLLAFILSVSVQQSRATDYYARASGNWNSATTWTTSAYQPCAGLLFPSIPAGGASVPTAADNVYIAAGFTVTVTAAGATCNNLTVGGGSYSYGLTCLLATTTPTTGLLTFASTGSYDLTIKGDLTTTASGSGLGTFNYIGNASRTHNVYLAGNLNNNGVIDFYADADDVVNLTFNNNNATISNSIIYSMPAAGSEFYSVIMNKGSKTTTVENQSIDFTNYINARTAASGCHVLLSQGTYIHNNAGDLNWLDNTIQSGAVSASAPYRANNEGFDLDANVVLEARQGIVRLCKPSSVAADAYVYLEGKLYINGGTVYACPTGSSSVEMFYASNGTTNTPELTIASGTLYNYGCFTALSSVSDKVYFTMTGGSMYVMYGATSTTINVPFRLKNMVSGSTFTMSGGTIYVTKPSTTAAKPDFDIAAPNVTTTVTGGTVEFGNASTAYTFRIGSNTGRVQPGIKVNGVSGTILQPVDIYATANYSFRSLYVAANNTFDSFNVGGSSTDMTLTSVYSGSNTFYLDGTFLPRTGTVTFNGGATQTMVTGNSTSFPFYSIVNAAGNTLAGAPSISVLQDWTNNNVYSPGTGTVTFNGTATQYIGGTASTGFYNLVLNKSSNNLVLNTSTSVGDNGVSYAGALTLTSGTLELNSHILTLTNGSTGAISRTGGYIKSETLSASPGGGTSPAGPGNGTVQWNLGVLAVGAHAIPFVSSSGSYIPFTIDGLSVGLGNVSVATYPSTSANTPYPAGVNHISDYTGTSSNNSSKAVDRFWIIGKSGLTGAANLTFTYSPGEAPAAGNVGSDGIGSKAQRYYNNLWQAPQAGQTPNTAGTYTVTAANVTIWGGSAIGAGSSPWALALNISPLPIELLSFTGAYNKTTSHVDLKWSTATEKNCDYFAVESSRDGSLFEPILYVNGAGNSTSVHKYAATDDEPYEGITYYRLKQYDYDGKSYYFNIVPVQIEPYRASRILIYPNPVADKAIVEISGDMPANLILRVEDMSGKVVMSRLASRTNRLELDLKDLAKGIYIINLSSDREVIVKSKILKQ